MGKRFLVLIDFSPFSKDQLLLAYHWSITIRAELLLIHSIVVAKPALTDAQTEKEIIFYEKNKATEKLKEFAFETLGEVPNIKFNVSEKKLLLLIPELLNQGNNDLIFVGLKGTGPLKKIFWGSTTIEIIRYLNQPVVAVPKNLPSYSPDKFYVAVNPRFPLNIPQLEYLLYLLGSQVKELVFFSVITDQNDHSLTIKLLKNLVEKFSKIKTSSLKIFEGRSAFEEIKSFMKPQNDAILIVQKGSRTLIDQFFRKLLVNELVYDGSIPLIVLPT